MTDFSSCGSLWWSINVPFNPFICNNEKTIQDSKHPSSSKTTHQKIPVLKWAISAAHLISAWTLETLLKLLTKTLKSDKRVRFQRSCCWSVWQVCALGVPAWRRGRTGNFCNPNLLVSVITWSAETLGSFWRNASSSPVLTRRKFCFLRLKLDLSSNTIQHKNIKTEVKWVYKGQFN